MATLFVGLCLAGVFLAGVFFAATCFFAGSVDFVTFFVAVAER